MSENDISTLSPRNSLPVVLRKLFLLSFGAVATILSACVVLLWHFSQGSDRFPVDGVNHYVLAYGPTAVLIWLVAFWRQIDFHVKESTPWTELHAGVSRASRSVLLDYISVLEISAFWLAARNRHIPVVVTTLGFALLKLATLSSTGLLLIENYDLQENATTHLESDFLARIIGDDNNTALSDKSLLYTTYGMLVQGLAKPFGVGDGLAYSTFHLDPVLSSPTNMTVQVHGFVPSFQCQHTDVFAVLPDINSTDSFPETIVQINNSQCSLRSQDVALYTLNPRLFRCPARQLSGLIRSVDCPPTVFDAEEGAYTLFVMADFRYSQSLDTDDSETQLSAGISAQSWSTEIARLNGLICKLGYSLGNVSVETFQGNVRSVQPVSTSDTASTSKLDSFSDIDLDRLFRASLSASDGILGDRTQEGYALEYPDPIMKLMALSSGGGYDSLLDSQVMARTASTVSTQLAAQIAHQYLRTNVSTEIATRTNSAAIRLKISNVSAYIMLVSLASVASLCLCLISLLRDYTFDSSQSTLLQAASLVRQSSNITPDLIKSSVYTEKQLGEALHDVDIQTVHHSSGRTELCLEKLPAFPISIECEEQWWNPFTVSKLMLVTGFSLTVAVIVVLEVLQRLSSKYHGFATLHSESTTETILTRFAPALFFLLLTSLYNCLDFNASLLEPFHKMKTSASLADLRNHSQLGRIPVLTWIYSLRTRSWGTASSSSAALTGSLLTIVVSGLFRVETSLSAMPFSVLASNAFTPTWDDSGLQDGGASLVSSLIENLDFAYPPGTFDEVAFSSLRGRGNVEAIGNSPVILDIPSWRAHLRCEQLPRSEYGVRYSSSRIQNSVTINASYVLPENCAYGGANGSSPVLEFVQTFPFPTTQNSTYLGKLLDLHVGPYDSIIGSAQGERVPSAMNDNPLGCPSFALLYGFINLDASASAVTELADMVTVEVCYQHIQSLQTTFHFLSSNFDVNVSNPPQIDETSVKYVSVSGNVSTYTDEVNSATAFPFRLQGHFDKEFVVFNNTHDNVFSGLSDLGNTVDPFFQGVLFGRTPLPLSSLKLENGVHPTRIQEGILSFYRRYMAQAISSNMRGVVDALQGHGETFFPDSNGSFIGTAPTAIVTKRIVQHNTSKLVLQAMLGSMLMCGIFTASTVQMHNVLPACANPCTIWGQMSLWAGSTMMKTAEDEAAERPNEGSCKLVLLESHTADDVSTAAFRLGWWTNHDGKRRYGIDVLSKTNVVYL